MCKVRITNYSNNYSYNSETNPTIEMDIPRETFLFMKQAFDKLNSNRAHACTPCIDIKEI